MIDRDFDYTELLPDGPRPCAVAECDQTEDDGELAQCIECKRHVCALDRRKIGEEIYCKTCGECSQCKRQADASCTECGALVCEAHATTTETCEPCGAKVTA